MIQLDLLLRRSVHHTSPNLLEQEKEDSMVGGATLEFDLSFISLTFSAPSLFLSARVDSSREVDAEHGTQVPKCRGVPVSSSS